MALPSSYNGFGEQRRGIEIMSRAALSKVN